MVETALLIARLTCVILALQPSREPERAESYAEVHVELGAEFNIDPVLLCAEAEVETNHRHRLVGDDGTTFGLFQGLCKAPWCKRLGDDMRASARLGVAELARWRGYHERRCKGRPAHRWYAHHNSGGKVWTGAEDHPKAKHYAGYDDRVDAVRERIGALLRGRCRLVGGDKPVDNVKGD